MLDWHLCQKCYPLEINLLLLLLEWRYSSLSLGGGGGVYRRIYVRKSCFTAALTRRCKTKFPTVYPTIYLPK